MADPTAVRILLVIQLDDEGAVKSSHRTLMPEDKAQLEAWPSGGQAQLAHALFIEALRREAYTMMISQLSQGKPKDQLSIEDLEEHIQAHWIKIVSRPCPISV